MWALDGLMVKAGDMMWNIVCHQLWHSSGRCWWAWALKWPAGDDTRPGKGAAGALSCWKHLCAQVEAGIAVYMGQVVTTAVVLRWRLVANICELVANICVLVAVICVQVTLDASGRRCNFNEQVWASIEHWTALSWCTFVICQFSWLLAEDSSVLIMIVCLQEQE